MLNDPLKFASEALGKAIDTEKRNRKLLDSIGPAIIQSLSPVLDRIETAVSRMRVDVKPVIEVNPEVKAPEVIVNVPDFPEVIVPTPIVNYTPPAINIPKIEMPDEMNIKGWVSLMGVSLEHPLPVQLRNADGSPVNLDITQMISGGGGGRGVVKVSGYDSSAFGLMLNPDGRLRVETNDGTSSATTEVRQVSGAVDSVVVNDILAVSTVFPVSQVSGANWSVNIASQDFTFDTKQVSGSVASVVVNDILVSVPVFQLSGSINSVKVTGFDTSVATTLIDSSGIGYSGSNPLPITGTVTVSGSPTSVFAVGPVLHDSADAGDAPVKVGGTAMQTNPTAVSDGDIIRFTGDDLGRQLVRPIQVRDLILTAYGTSSTGIETTLLTAAAGTFADCIMLTATNASSAAVQVDIRAVSGGNIIHTFYLPATTGPIGWAPAVPWPQDATGNAWTWDVSGSDVSNTNVYISGLFSKEI